MSALIQLQYGSPAASENLKAYFDAIFLAEQSGEEFPVDLSHVWRIGYGTKGAAVKQLRKGFVQDVDYTSFIQVVKRDIGATSEEVVHLSVSCMEYLIVRANRAVFEIYRACRRVLQAQRQPPKDYIGALKALIDAEEGKQRLQLQLAEAAPKVEFFDAVASADNAVSFADAAKSLKLPGLEGQQRLMARLRADGVLMASNVPYQAYIDAGYFVVVPQTYENNKGTQLTHTGRVTGRGMEWLSRKYRPVAATALVKL